MSGQLTWKAVGPAPQVSEYTDKVSGRVLSLAISPDYDGKGSPALYIGVDGGGLWRSTNFQMQAPNWVNLTDQVPASFRPDVEQITSITIDPRQPGVVYMTGGTAPGIFRSGDGGATWNFLPIGATNVGRVTKIIVDPTDRTNSTLYILGSSAGPFKSTNGGVNWQLQINGFSTGNGVLFADMEYTLDQNGQLALYVSTINGPDAADDIWTSNNQGALWQPMHIKLIELGTGNIVPTSLMVAPLFQADHNPGTPNGLYLAVTKFDNAYLYPLVNVFRLAKGTWTPTGNNGLANLNGQSAFSFGMSPEGTLYIGGQTEDQKGLFQSTDRGENWANVDIGANGIRPHTDHHTWGFFSGLVYNGNDGGIWRFTPLPNQQAGQGNWDSLNTSSIQTILAQGVCLHPTDSDICLCGSQDNGIALLENGSWIETNGGDNSKILFDPDPSNSGKYAYTTGVSNYSFFFRSDDGGHSWNDKSPADAATQKASIDWYAPFAIHPNDTCRIAVGIDRVYETLDRGDHWGTAKSPVFFKPQSSAISYATNDTIWVAYGNKIFLTVNAGGDGSANNWMDARAGTDFGGSIIKIAVDPRFPESVYLATDSGKVWRTKTNGAAWDDITGNLPNLPIFTLALIPGKVFEDPILIVGTSLGIFLSFNQTQTLSWGPFNAGLPFAKVQDLEYCKPLNRVAAAVYGRGIYVSSPFDIQEPSVTIRLPENECGIAPVEGSIIAVGYTVIDAPPGLGWKNKWTIQGGQPAPGETGNQPYFHIVVPSVGATAIITVEIDFDNSFRVSASKSIRPIGLQNATWAEHLCKLQHVLKVNFLVNPLWDPTRDLAVHPYTEADLAQIRQGAQEIVTTFQQTMELLSKTMGK